MLAAFAGGEALEIVVALKDLSEAGLRNLEKNIRSAEKTANATSFSGFSKNSKTLAADAEAAAGKGGKGGLSSLLGGFLGVPGPVQIAGAALLGFAGLAEATLPVYEKVEHQEKLLNDALIAHGDSLDAERSALEDAIRTGEQYGMSADDTRAAVTKLVEAGISFKDVQKGLPEVYDLAIAKNLSAADAADILAKATVGSAKGLADLGIKLPLTSVGLVAQKAASKELATATDGVQKAQQHLADVEDKLRGKHHLTAAEARTLKDAHDKLNAAEGKLKTAHDHVATAADTAAGKARNFADATNAVRGATGDTRDSIDALKVKTATLGDKWETFTTKIGPALKSILGAVVDLMTAIVDRISAVLDLFAKGTAAANLPHVTASSGVNTRQYYVPPRHAEGGWVGLNGPEIGLLGERGPEFITRNGNLPVGGGGSASVVHTHIYLDGREIAHVVDRHLGGTLALRGTGAMSFGGG